jgi:ferredoxin/flavodoxin
MNITSINTILFSPTGTSRKVALAVADALSLGNRIVDATYSTPSGVCYKSDELVIVAVPVYGGKVAPLALQRIEALQGNNTPIVLIAVYGNRAYEEALVQLDEFVRCRGFVPIAAGAFVGEHSYSTSRYPIAKGRPDATDLADARAWGKSIGAKLAQIASPEAVNVASLKAPTNSFMSQLRFVNFIKEQRQVTAAAKPKVEVDADKCKLCGKCAKPCPTGAISTGDYLHTDTSRCIKCCACVKGCPAKARTLDTPYAPVLSQCFGERKSPVIIL